MRTKRMTWYVCGALFGLGIVHRRRALAPLGLLFALVLVAPVARAAPPQVDDDAVAQHVAELYKQANALYDAQKLTEAEALYREAWALKRPYDVACNLGALELDLGNAREAAEYLAHALRSFPARGEASVYDRIKARFALARAKVGGVRVRVNVAGAFVTVDGRALGQEPVDGEVFVNPGVVAIRATAPGFEPAQRSVTVQKGSSAVVTLTLTTPQRSLTPGIVLGAGAGVAVVAGAALLAQRAAEPSDASRAGTFTNAGVGLLLGAGALAAATVAYFVWPAATPTRSNALGVVPTVSASSAGVLFSGSF